MKKILAVFVIGLLLAGTFSGCQTWQGLGRDVENLGRKMQ